MSPKSCLYIEVEPTEWFYLAENEDAPDEVWDWREYSTASGPFDTLEAAMDHRVDNRPDISGSEIRHYDPKVSIPPVVMSKIKDAGSVQDPCKY